MKKLAQALFSLLAVTMAAPAFADCWWQWEGIHSRWTCDECGSTGCSTIPVVEDQTYGITVRNSCWEGGAISVALLYNSVNSGWRTDGYWTIAPGESKYLADTLSNEFYYWAGSRDGRNWSGNVRRRVNSDYKNFRYKSGNYVNLTCD